MSQDGDLSKIFCYLNQAEALLETCRNMSVNDGIVSMKHGVQNLKVSGDGWLILCSFI